MPELQTIELDGTDYVLIRRSDYERLRNRAGSADDPEMPALPQPDSEGNYPAVAYARTSLARKIIRRRRAAGLTQVELARRAGIRPETLNRIERGNSTPGLATIEKIDRALNQAEAEPAE